MDDQRISEPTRLSTYLPSTSRPQNDSETSESDAWPRKPKGPWVTFVRRETPSSAKGLQQGRTRVSYLTPMFVNDEWRAFYAWCRSYARQTSQETFPWQCPVCQDARKVLTKRREMVVCPQWSGEQRRCVKPRWEER